MTDPSPVPGPVSQTSQDVIDLAIGKFNERLPRSAQQAWTYDNDDTHDYALLRDLIAALQQAQATIQKLQSQKIDLAMRCGQILGPEWDGEPFDKLALAYVAAQATIPHLQALVDKWRKLVYDRAEWRQGRLDGPAMVLQSCVEELAALLSAIPAPREEK